MHECINSHICISIYNICLFYTTRGAQHLRSSEQLLAQQMERGWKMVGQEMSQVKDTLLVGQILQVRAKLLPCILTDQKETS